MNSKGSAKVAAGWIPVIASGAVALATCGLVELGESEAEGQLREVEPPRAAADPSAGGGGEAERCEAARDGARLLRARALCEGCSPRGAVVELTYDRVVDADEVVSSLQIRPEVPLESRSGRCARRVLVGGLLAAQTEYELTIGEGDGERILQFGTGGGSPRVRMPAPMAVLAADGNLPVQLMGIRRARLRAMRLRADEIARAAEVAGVYPRDEDPASRMPRGWSERLRARDLDPDAGDEQGIQRIDPFDVAGGRGPVLAILDAPGVRSRVSVVQRAVNAVVLKVGAGGGVVWVADPRTGRPVANATVTIFEGTERRAGGRTDRDGLYRLPAAARLRRDATIQHAVNRRGRRTGRTYTSGPPLRAVVRAGGHVTYASESFSTGIEPWQLEIPFARTLEGSRTRGMVTAERGIYRPGESVHLLGIVRELADDGALRAPRGRVQLRVLDPDGNPVHEERVRFTAYGTFRDELALPSGARLGRYQVIARPPAGGELVHRFEVGEYRPDTFSVEVPPAGPAELVDGEIAFPIRARYLYGAPLAEVEAQWTLSWRPRRIQVSGAPGYRFGTEGAGHGGYARFLTSGTASLDARGEAEVRLPRTLLPMHESAQAVDLVFEARVLDEAGDTVAGRTVQTLSTRERWVGLRSERWVVDAGDGWDVSVVAVTPDGSRVEDHPIRLRLIHPTWRTHAERGSGGVRYDGEWEDVVVAEREVRSTRADRRVHFGLPGGGRYRVELVDDTGSVLTEAQVWAAGGGAHAPVYNHPRMEIVADQPSYQPGDRATLYAQVPWERSLALVTVEREGVMEARVERLDGAATPIRVDVTDEHAPNVFVGVSALPISTESPASGVPLRVGYHELPVSAERRRLHVAVRPAQDDYEPGEEAAVDVQVTDHRGRPVRAEVTLWAADEGVLQLTGYPTPDPFAPAYAQHPNTVATAASVAQWTQRDPYTWPDGGGDAPAGEGTALRSRFLSTAFFSRAVVTNRAGRARVRFETPDNLTRWRVMAAVADRGERFGRGEAAVTTSKPLSAMPTLPRFLTQGDLVDAGVVVHNHTGADGTAEVRLSVDGPAEIVGDAVRRVEIPDGARVPVRFGVIAGGTGEVSFRARVQMGQASDGWRRALPVNPATAWSSQRVAGGALEPGAGGWFAMPSQIDGDQAELLVTVSHGVYAAMEAGLDSLIRYPHGCVEQTTSGLIPMVLLEDLLRDLGSGRLASADHRQRMGAAIEHVMRHQNGDGGFGLWPSSSSEGFLTAYALWGLLTARDHGYAIDDGRVQRAMAYLEEHATQGDDMHGQFSPEEIGPFAAYVLAHAQRDDRGLSTRLAGDEDHLSRFGVGLVADALSRRERRGVDPLFEALEEAAEPVGDARLVQDPNAGGSFMRFGTDVRATSSAVQALVAAGRRSEAADLVSGILGQRRSDGSWGSTYNNMWALYALTSYAQAAGSPARSEAASVEVQLDGRAVGRLELGADARARQIVIPASSLPRVGHGARLTLQGPVGADLRFSARLRYVTDAAHQRPESHGLTVSRQLIDAQTGHEVEHPAVGQIVRVRLRVVATRPLEQVAVMDYLPAGFEAIDDRLATRGHAGARASGDRWSHQEVHDERVTFFADRLPSGTRVAEYLAQVSRSGEFVRPAPRAEAMYDPEIYGLGSIERVVVAASGD